MDGWMGEWSGVEWWMWGFGCWGRGEGDGTEGCGGGWGEELARCLWFLVDVFLVEVVFGAIPRGVLFAMWTFNVAART